MPSGSDGRVNAESQAYEVCRPRVRYTSVVLRVYIRVILLEAAIVVALVVLGHLFS